MEVVNCPGAFKEALMRQQELAMATAQLSSDSFGGFNHGTRQSAVAGPMGFCKQANSSMPVGEHQMPFQELTDPEMWKPGLEGWNKDFIKGSEFGAASAEPEVKKKRPGYALALRHSMDEGTTTARKKVLDAANTLEECYARPAGNNKARTLEQALKNCKPVRIASEAALDALVQYKAACAFWKGIPVQARTMSEQKCHDQLELINAHAGVIAVADKTIARELMVIGEEKSALATKARTDGAAGAREEKKALQGFQNAPQHLLSWLVRSGAIRVEGRPGGGAVDTMPQLNNVQPAPPQKPTFIPSLGEDVVSQQLKDVLPMIMAEVTAAVVFEKARLHTGSGVFSTQLQSCDSLAGTTDWVPAAWLAAGLGPQGSVEGWCAPWLLSQRSGTTRMTSDQLPTNGFATLYTVVEGQGWVFCWHASSAEAQGGSLVTQYQYLLNKQFAADAREWLGSAVSIKKVKAGDQVWVPFGFYSIVLCDLGLPIIMMALPWFNPKQLTVDPATAELVLVNQTRILQNCSLPPDKRRTPAGWTRNHGLDEFLNWCRRGTRSLEKAEVLREGLEGEQRRAALTDTVPAAEVPAAVPDAVPAAPPLAPLGDAQPVAPLEDSQTQPETEQGAAETAAARDEKAAEIAAGLTSPEDPE